MLAPRSRLNDPEDTSGKCPPNVPIWAAYRHFAERVKGSIEPGKLADLTVIDRDYLTCPEDQIKAIEPVMTIIDGQIAWRATVGH